MKLSIIAAAVMLSANAHAITLQSGDIKFTFDSYNLGTGGYTSTPGVKCITTGACDALAPAADAYGSDIWGIFSIAAMSNISTGETFWSRGQDGQYLTGLFGGMQDAYVEVTGGVITRPTTTVLTTGGWLNMYMNTVDYDPKMTPAGRTDEFEFTGITSGNKVLSTVFAGSAYGALPYSYMSQYDTASLSGSGRGFMDVVGGEWESIFNSNGLFDTAQMARDMYFDVTFNDVDQQASSNGWSVTSSGQVKTIATPVPEPGILALMGLGLLGLGMIRKVK
jgi:hypothetical protein